MFRLSLIVILLAAPVTWAQTGGAVVPNAGVPYGTRDAHACTSTREPLKGAPSAAQAKAYVTCAEEGVFGNSYYLVDNVLVQVAGPRPFSMATDPFDDIDPSQPVYNIRGSFTQYQCGRLSAVTFLGKNCSVHPHPNASGKCYKDTFGSWHCAMQDSVNGSDYHQTIANQPPPK